MTPTIDPHPLAALARRAGRSAAAPLLLAAPLVAAPQIERDPVPVARWEPLAPLEGAGPAVFGIESSVAAPDTLTAFSSAGVLRSDDVGASWSLVCPWPAEVSTQPRAAVSPADPGRIAVAHPLGGTLLVTLDGGHTWRAPLVPPGSGAFAPLAFDPFDPDVLFVGATDGVWRSRDGGATFERILDTAGMVTVLEVARQNRLHVFAISSVDGVLASDDGGATWEHRGPAPVAGSITAFELDPRDPRRMVHGSLGCRISEDGGRTWSTVGNVQAAYDAVALDPLRPDRILGAERSFGVVVSDDDGASFSERRDPGLRTVGGGAQALHAPPAHPDVLVVGGIGGLARSTDGGATFTRTNHGLGHLCNVESVAFHPTNRDHMVAKTGGSAFVTVDGGQSWTESTSGDSFIGYDVVADPAHPGRFWAGGLGGTGAGPTLWRSDDGGATFAPVHVDPLVYFWHLCADPHGSGALYGAGRNVRRSDDGGASFTGLGAPSNWMWDVAASPTLAGHLLANSSSAIVRSTDGGATWTAAANSPGPIVRDLAPDPADPAVWYCAVPQFVPGAESVWRSHDGGDHWSALPTGLGNVQVVHVAEGLHGLVLAGQAIESGIWQVARGGALRCAGGPPCAVQGFASAAGRVVCATRGGGVYVMR